MFFIWTLESPSFGGILDPPLHSYKVSAELTSPTLVGGRYVIDWLLLLLLLCNDASAIVRYRLFKRIKTALEWQTYLSAMLPYRRSIPCKWVYVDNNHSKRSFYIVRRLFISGTRFFFTILGPSECARRFGMVPTRIGWGWEIYTWNETRPILEYVKNTRKMKFRISQK